MTWREEQHPRRPAGSPEGGEWVGRASARLGRHTLVHTIVDESEAQSLLTQVSGTDIRSEYVRRAIRDKLEMPDHTTLLVVKDHNGMPVGAASLVDYPTRDTPHSVIQSMGALEGTGAGQHLLGAAIVHTLSRRRAVLYTEPTANAKTYWLGQGFTPDPLETGAYYYGLTVEGMHEWYGGRD